MGDYVTEREYSNLISELRYHNKLEDAIYKCKEAISEYPQSNFFYKLLGDLLAQDGDFENAGKAYINHLKYIDEKPDLFNNFVRFYQLLIKNTSEEYIKSFQYLILNAVRQGEISLQIKEKLASVLSPQLFLDEKVFNLLKTGDDRNFYEIKKTIETINDNYVMLAIINLRINTKDNPKSHKIDEYLVSKAEKLEMYIETLKLIKKIFSSTNKLNPTIVRTLFRVCRKQEDYSTAESIFPIDTQFINKSDFNVQYELVYYFEHIENTDLLNRTLNQMRSSASSSIPISRTLYNFYLKFNRFDDAREMAEHIRSLGLSLKNSSQARRIEEQLESEQGVWDKLQDLLSEQEHNRQMIAMRDLLKGFSHELGQPITNIRYSTQLYRMKAQKGVLSEDSIEELIELILNQTDRIGNLLARFRPIVSSKSKNIKFNVFERISAVFLDLSVRLKTCNIDYSLRGNKEAQLWGDPVQFDQVFYNLILNSMQAISQVNEGGKIDVKILALKNGNLKIIFSDNGPGIVKENGKKIFEPFYTTKDPSIQNDGGEGLGLFIVWNVLKMFNGNIKLDIQVETGAKFIISIKPKEVTINE